MKAMLALVPVLALFGADTWRMAAATPSPRFAPPAPSSTHTIQLDHLPIAYVPNLGQWDERARFVAQVGAMTVFLESNGWAFTMLASEASSATTAATGKARGGAVRMTFVGAQDPEFVAEQPLPGRHNYLLGDDATRWRCDVPLFGAVLCRGMHPGIDVRVRSQDGHFEYDLLLQPTADLERVVIAVDGIDGLRVDGDGALVVATTLGPVRMPAPRTWETGPAGECVPVPCHYVLHDARHFGFVVPARRPGWSLVVDPGLQWSTLLGGADNDVRAVAVDAEGVTTAAGMNWSPTFPTTTGAFDVTDAGIDAFVTRVAADGASLVYSTFLGGTFSDWATAIAIDSQGAATIAGVTESGDFPTTPGAFDTSYNGPSSRDGFVARLSPSGSSLLASTYLGGANDDEVRAVAIDAQGRCTVAGSTASANFPTTAGSFDTTYGGGSDDAFVVRLGPNLANLVYATFLGGWYTDQANALAVDAQGVCTVAGYTGSPNFPIGPIALDPTYNGAGSDAFVTRLAASGASLVFSTFLGGTDHDSVLSLALDAEGGTTVAGVTLSTNFPTTAGAFDTSWNGGHEGFVARVSPLGTQLTYATYLGGSADELPLAVAVDALGACTVVGDTNSSDFPITPGALQTSMQYADAFVTRLSPTGSTAVYSTFLGGAGVDRAQAIAVDAQGVCTVGGFARGPGFPTTAGAYATVFAGYQDGFLMRLDTLPAGVRAFGSSSPGCAGPLTIHVTSMPNVGNAAFAILCANAPPSGIGVLGFTLARLPAPVTVLGVQVWLEAAPVLELRTVSSDALGRGGAALPIPGNPALVGAQLFTQFAWYGPSGPASCPPLGWSTSRALEITLQP